VNKRSTTTWGLALGVAAVPVLAHAEPAVLRVPVRRPAAQIAAQSPQAAAQIEVLVLEGSNGTGGIAPGVAQLSQLRRPPFSAYPQITLVSRTTLPLGAAPSSVAVPGGSASLTSEGRGPNGRYTVVVHVTQNGHTHDLRFAASPGDPFFTVRATGADRALILGFIVH
jgi:hypothetical protein